MKPTEKQIEIINDMGARLTNIGDFSEFHDYKKGYPLSMGDNGIIYSKYWDLIYKNWNCMSAISIKTDGKIDIFPQETDQEKRISIEELKKILLKSFKLKKFQ